MDISSHPLLSHFSAPCLASRMLALNTLFTDCASQLEGLVAANGRNQVSLGDLYFKVHSRLLRASLPCAAVAPDRMVAWFRMCIRNLRRDRGRKDRSVHGAECRRQNERPEQPRGDLDAAIDLEHAVCMLDRIDARLRKDQDFASLARFVRLRQALAEGDLEACSLRGAATVLACSHTSARRFLNAMAAYGAPECAPRRRRTAG